MNSVTLLGIDIGKNSSYLHGQDAQGHQLQLIEPQHVKAYVTGNENDFIDADPIAKPHHIPEHERIPALTWSPDILAQT